MPDIRWVVLLFNGKFWQCSLVKIWWYYIHGILTIRETFLFSILVGMDKQSSCTNAHYYQAGDKFLVSARDKVHDGHCPLTFLQLTGDGSGYMEPCLSLCVKIVSYSMESCLVKMTYHDGVKNFSPIVSYLPNIWLILNYCVDLYAYRLICWSSVKGIDLGSL